MQTPKIIGAGVCALFAIGSLFNALGSLVPAARTTGGAAASSGGGSNLAVSAIAFLVFAGLAFFLWRSAKSPGTRV